MDQWLRKLGTCFSLLEDNDPLGQHDDDLWSEDLRKHAYGEFSLAVVQANMTKMEKSQVEAGKQATFIGLYDGHGGADTSEFVAEHLFDHLNRFARDRREISESIITDTIAETERGYLGYVRFDALAGQQGRSEGSCCLVGVIWNKRLYVGNLGDSRAVLGVSYQNRIRAEQVTEDHNANLENIRAELLVRHLGDPDDVVVKNNGRWRVRGVLEVTRAIGDFTLKYQDLAVGPNYPRIHLPQPLIKPYIRVDPQLHVRELEENCRFVIFASDGLWDCMTNQEAVNIVHRGPREGIARRLAVKAMKNAAKKGGITYTDFKDLGAGQRRNFHDDITVAVVFIDRLEPVDDPEFNPITVRGNRPNVVPSNFDF